MMYARLAALASAATMVLCSAVHAAAPAPTSVPPSQPVVVSAGVQPVSAIALPATATLGAGAANLQPAAVQLALNTFEGARPGPNSAAMEAQGTPPDAAPSYLVSATRYVQDVGTFWSGPAAPAEKISEVPLPGALWLFGSALLAFLAISVRRKF